MSETWFYYDDNGPERVCKSCGRIEWSPGTEWRPMHGERELSCPSCRPAPDQTDKLTDDLLAEQDRAIVAATAEINRLRAEVERLTRLNRCNCEACHPSRIEPPKEVRP